MIKKIEGITGSCRVIGVSYEDHAELYRMNQDHAGSCRIIQNRAGSCSIMQDAAVLCRLRCLEDIWEVIFKYA